MIFALKPNMVYTASAKPRIAAAIAFGLCFSAAAIASASPKSPTVERRVTSEGYSIRRRLSSGGPLSAVVRNRR
eukprot:CAMPEP_0179932424 /NCGR_PEP_ID=MMETSP0983-20121128/11258_1 /TAXON_ID=483367 /ORGANISM="non described non described, Strain CCMP 2436" /LENGTH=73 /DNA_ID=CAMNT_0021837023 /DNA_START=30 /DNA_END=251 /DNA_ORIENTATION=-